MKRKKLKLALVNCPISERSSTPHMGLMCLAAYARDLCPWVEIKIFESLSLTKIKRFKPDMVGFTSDTMVIAQTIAFAEKLKKLFKIPLIIGGVHITSCPQTFNKIFDLGVIGEGEFTLVELLNLYKKDKKFSINKMKEIKGLIFRNKGKLVFTGKRELIKDLDSLPVPARDLVPMEEVYLKNQVNLYGVKRNAVVMTSRGCPYHCIYCGSPVQWGSVRVHSPEYIVKEIDLLIKKYRVDAITFSDDLFIFPKDRLFKLVELIRQKGWDKKIVFTGFGRANMIDDDICRALKSINTHKLTFGFESYSEPMLAYLKDHSVFVKDNIRTIKLCHKYGIAVASGLIVGSPGEKIKDLKKTYETMKKYPMDNTQIYILTPYPGTKIWNYAEKLGLVSLEMDMNKLFVEIPLRSLLLFWKKNKFDFLNERVFLNTKMQSNKEYMNLILKLNLLAWWQNMGYYFKTFLKDPGLLWRMFEVAIIR